jgi:murein endopeptidase
VVGGGKAFPVRRLNIACAFLAVVAIAGTTAQGAAQTTLPPPPPPPAPSPAASDSSFVPADAAQVQWRDSYAAGTPQQGFLVRGIKLPAEGVNFFTWDFPLSRSPSRPWRRWGTDTTIAITLQIAAEYRAANPGAPRVGIADISRPHGGPFGREFGGLGHASHQNGLDVDILYPRRDGTELAPMKPSQVDQRLAQDLVDRLVAAGAVYVFVGPHLKLSGPRRIVQKLVFHDNHMHVRFPRKPRTSA